MRYFAILIMISAIIFSAQVYATERISASFDNKVETIGLGDFKSIGFTVKNMEDDYITIDIHAGSPDDQFRNWIWFGKNRFSANRTIKKARFAPHEERLITVNVFGGKTGSYEIFVGPDGTDTNKAYGSKKVSIVRTKDQGLFSRSPGITFLGLVISVFGSLILLIRKSNGYRRNFQGR